MLSTTIIKSLKIEDGKRHADRDGLVLELRPSKKKLNKVFIFRFQWDKKPQTITIENYQSISLAEARDKKAQPISEASVRKLLHNGGFNNRHTAHGFRSLFSGVLHEEGHFRSEAIEAQLAHKVQGVKGVYIRAEFRQERRELMDWYSNWLCNDIDQPEINKFIGANNGNYDNPARLGQLFN